MHARRIIAAPIVALSAMLLVGAIIESGQQARATHANGGSQALSGDPDRTSEARRIRDLLAASSSCATGTAACSPEANVIRIRRAAADVARWPYDRRFHAVRATLRSQLLAEASVLDQRAANDVDGHTTLAERARLDLLEDQRHDAVRAAARAQRAARLIDRATYDALVEDEPHG